MFLIREYSPQDAAQLEDCIVELQSFEKSIEPNRADGLKIAPAYRKLLLTRCGQGQGKIFVAQMDGRVIAFICILLRLDEGDLIEDTPEFAYITDLVVLPAYRGQGVGRMLLQHAETYALRHEAAVLKVDVLAGNTIARELYTRMGYHEHEIRLQKHLWSAGSS